MICCSVMSQSPIQKRHSRCKAKVLHNLLDCYKTIKVAPWPCHFFCPGSKTFIRIEVDKLDEKMRLRLQQFKEKMCRDGEKVQVFLFRRYAHKPEVVDIR